MYTAIVQQHNIEYVYLFQFKLMLFDFYGDFSINVEWKNLERFDFFSENKIKHVISEIEK